MATASIRNATDEAEEHRREIYADKPGVFADSPMRWDIYYRTIVTNRTGTQPNLLPH